MLNTCPECGTILSEDTSCQTIFEGFLVLEFSDPDYGEVHVLTVACYMIQYGRYSDEALLWIRDKLRAHLEGSLPVDVIRRQAGRETGQAKRTWPVIRVPDARPLTKIAWTMTIADVAAGYRDAASDCALVKRWASITVQEMQPWL
jgi:hypothetical protein